MNLDALKSIVNEMISLATHDESESLQSPRFKSHYQFRRWKKEIEWKDGWPLLDADDNFVYTSIPVYYNSPELVDGRSTQLTDAIAVFKLYARLERELHIIFSNYLRLKKMKDDRPWRLAPKGFAIYYLALVTKKSTLEYKRWAAMYALLSVEDADSPIRYKLSEVNRDKDRYARAVRNRTIHSAKLSKLGWLNGEYEISDSEKFKAQFERAVKLFENPLEIFNRAETEDETQLERYIESRRDREYREVESPAERTERLAAYE